jgi:hypothetical protein
LISTITGTFVVFQSQLKIALLESLSMKKLILLCTLTFLGTNSAVSRDEKTKSLYTMPDEAVLKKRLSYAGFDFFDKTTHLSKQLANQEKYCLVIAMTVEIALYNFEQAVDPLTARLMYMRKSQLLEALLEDCPQCLKELEAKGLYE